MKYTFKLSLNGYHSAKNDHKSKDKILFSLSFDCDMEFTPYIGMMVIFKQNEDVEIEEELLEYMDHTGVFEIISFYCVIPDCEMFVNLSNADIEEKYDFEDALNICKLYNIIYGFKYYY